MTTNPAEEQGLSLLCDAPADCCPDCGRKRCGPFCDRFND